MLINKKYKPNWLSSVAAMYSEGESVCGINVRVIFALHEVIFYTCNDIIPMLRSKSTHKHSPHSLSFFSLHLPQAIKVIKTTKSFIFATLLKSLDYKIKECNTTAIFLHINN